MEGAQPEFLTVAEVAGLLRLNQQTVRSWIDSGQLPAVRVGVRRVRVRRSDLDALLAAGTSAARHEVATNRRVRRRPIQRRAHSRLRRLPQAWSANDLRDLQALSAAMVYADVVVTEKSWTALAQRAGLDERFGTTIVKDLNDLVSILVLAPAVKSA